MPVGLATMNESVPLQSNVCDMSVYATSRPEAGRKYPIPCFL